MNETSAVDVANTLGPLVRLRSRWREWLYRRLRDATMTMLTRQFLAEMLRSKVGALTWTVSMEYRSGIKDVLTMTVTCDKVESTPHNQPPKPLIK